jgi:hypothetical protein
MSYLHKLCICNSFNQLDVRLFVDEKEFVDDSFGAYNSGKIGEKVVVQISNLSRRCRKD